MRSRRLAGAEGFEVRAATAAVSADAAAVVCLVSQRLLSRLAPGFGCRIEGTASAGCDPALPGLAPVAATRKLAARDGLDLETLQVFEVMEAYTAQAIACVDALGLDPEKVNVNGGACALGHPIGASGARIIVTLLHALEARGGKRGIAALCIGGGEATAVAIERSI